MVLNAINFAYFELKFISHIFKMEKILLFFLSLFSIIILIESTCRCVKENSSNCPRYQYESYYERDNKICFKSENGQEKHCFCKEGFSFI